MTRRPWTLGACLAAAIMAAGAAAAQQGGNSGGTAKATAGPNLDGVWRGFVVYGKGEQPNRGTVHLELTIKGNRITAQRLDGQRGSLGQGAYKLTSGRLSVMDATETAARGKPKTYLGICAFAPDTIKWCVATPGNTRPTDFETKGQQFLLILKRQKG
ncbi:MAG: hypothetical protein ABR915_05785 [Thermoguttaceae bacterium]